MIFTENSFLVQLYVDNINNPNMPTTREDVPDLYNLREVVYRVLDA